MGVIDSGYTGELMTRVYNPTDNNVVVSDGDRIAQGILIPKHTDVEIQLVEELPQTERGATGFGSSTE